MLGQVQVAHLGSVVGAEDREWQEARVCLQRDVGGIFKVMFLGGRSGGPRALRWEGDLLLFSLFRPFGLTALYK